MSEDFEVEILFPEELVNHCIATTKRFSAAIAYYCKAAGAFVVNVISPNLMFGIMTASRLIVVFAERR